MTNAVELHHERVSHYFLEFNPHEQVERRSLSLARDPLKGVPKNESLHISHVKSQLHIHTQVYLSSRQIPNSGCHPYSLCPAV